MKKVFNIKDYIFIENLDLSFGVAEGERLVARYKHHPDFREFCGITYNYLVGAEVPINKRDIKRMERVLWLVIPDGDYEIQTTEKMRSFAVFLFIEMPVRGFELGLL